VTRAHRILIVDDDRDICETMEEILRLEGYEPSVALSGAAALAALRHASFDVVLLDIRMPEMDGIETLRRLREIDAGLPVIMHTAYGVDARVRQALDLGGEIRGRSHHPATAQQGDEHRVDEAIDVEGRNRGQHDVTRRHRNPFKPELHLIEQVRDGLRKELGVPRGPTRE